MPKKDILTELHGYKAGLNASGSLLLNRPDGSQVELGGVGGNQSTDAAGVSTITGGSRTLTLTAAQVNALFTTPQTLVPAPGAGLANIFRRLVLRTVAGTAYTVGAGSDLVVKYTNAAGVQASSVVETTGFLDQATAQLRVVTEPGSTGTTAGDTNVAINAALVLHCLSANPSGGTSPLTVMVQYDVINATFAP